MAHQSWVQSFSGLLIRNKARIALIGKEAFLYLLYNLFYDFVFYPLVIGFMGYVVGGLIAVGGSFLQCGIMFWLYDRNGSDWLGAHALRELDDEESQSRLKKVATWIGREKRTWWEHVVALAMMVPLTSVFDPLVVAVHFQSQHFKGLTRKDWGLLLAALVSANGLWLMKSGIGVAIFKALFLGHI